MKSLNAYFFKMNYHNAWVFNGVLWLFSFFILLFSFTENNNPIKIDYIYTGSFLITIIIPVLINLYVLIPKFLKKENYLIYISFFLVNVFVSAHLNAWFFDSAIDYIFPEYYFISYHSNMKLVTIFMIFLIATTLIKLSEDWFYYNKKENQELKNKNQQIQAQLNSLRSQINPHFLFNSLNVIYALAIEEKKEIKGAIVQLSDILRYIIYDSNTQDVTIKEEIIVLKNYIEFQKLRHHDSGNINLVHHIKDENKRIYPMLLLPLIENSFKYGIKGDIKNTFIDIEIIQNDTEFKFVIKNNYVKKTSTTNEYSGLGLENIKKNLEIIYPEKHEFVISKTEDKFIVSLKLFDNED